MIHCGSSYDGVQRPLGEAFTWSVIDEGYHDYWPIHPRWGQLHQLTDIQINIRRMCLCICSAKQNLLVVIYLQLCSVYLSWCGKFDPVDKIMTKHWMMMHFLSPKGVPSAGCVGVQNSVLHNYFLNIQLHDLRSYWQVHNLYLCSKRPHWCSILHNDAGIHSGGRRNDWWILGTLW